MEPAAQANRSSSLTDAGVEASTASTPAPVRTGGRRRQIAVGDAVVALLVIVYGIYLVNGAGLIRVLPVYSRIGPRFFPYLVGFGALTCGVLLLIGALLGDRSQPEGGEDVDLGVRDNLRPVLVIAVAL